MSSCSLFGETDYREGCEVAMVPGSSEAWWGSWASFCTQASPGCSLWGLLFLRHTAYNGWLDAWE